MRRGMILCTRAIERLSPMRNAASLAADITQHAVRHEALRAATTTAPRRYLVQAVRTNTTTPDGTDEFAP